MKYYVTTGTSLSQESRCWFTDDEITAAAAAGNAPQRDPHFDAPKYNNLLELLDDPDADLREVVAFIRQERSRGRQFATAAAGLFEGLPQAQHEAEADRLAAERFDVSCFDVATRHLLPAELATLLMMARLNENGTFFQTCDEIHFLGGKSNFVETLMACAALRLASGKNLFGVGQENITCSYNREFDPLNRAGFRANMDEVWKNGLQEKLAARTAQLVVTGGYKGVAVALAVRIVDEDTNFYYMHEAAKPTDRSGDVVVRINVRDGYYE